MAQKKDQKKSPSKSYSVKKKTPPEKNSSSARKRVEEQQRISDMKKEEYKAIWKQTVPYLLIVGAILLIICFFTGKGEEPGIVTGFIYNVMTGFFSISAIVIPVFLIFAGVSELIDKGDNIIGMRTVFALVSSVLFSSLFPPTAAITLSKCSSGEQTSAAAALSAVLSVRPFSSASSPQRPTLS